jgi:hypothetical protein
MVSKALSQIVVVCLRRGAFQGTRENGNAQEVATYDFAHGGYMSQPSRKANKSVREVIRKSF